MLENDRFVQELDEIRWDPTGVISESDLSESCQMVSVGSHRLLFIAFDRFLSVGIRSDGCCEIRSVSDTWDPNVGLNLLGIT